MLKRLFTSNTRIKLLTVFVSNIDQEYYIRELTRKLNEQINSIRRELDNLKKMGFLKSKLKNRKKYYYINKNFIILDELKLIIKKVLSDKSAVAKKMAKLGKIRLLVLSGQFVENQESNIDILIVGEIEKEKLTNFINEEFKLKNPVKFAIMSVADYEYRVNCHDKFINDILNNSKNQVLIKNI